MNLKKRWIEHLEENKMSYLQHFKFAVFYALICFLSGTLLIVHAICPAFYQTAGSDLIQIMARVFKKRNQIDDT
jgi:hypothetical protein